MSTTSRRNKKKGRKTTKRMALGDARCPQCNIHGDPVGMEGLLVCRQCGALFDGETDEGGDYSDFNPAARLERAEQLRENRYGGKRR